MSAAPTFEGSSRAGDERTLLPTERDVLREQLRAIGVALRVPTLAIALLGVVATIAFASQIVAGDMRWNLLTQPSSLPGIIGALLPVAIWAREERFGPGFLWTLPVDRSRHALLKTLAGWLWLMGGVLLYWVALLVLALLAGGDLLPVETLTVHSAPATSAPVDPAALQRVRWAPGPTIWLVPVGAATATYLLASAFMLGVRRPLRWVAVAVLSIPVATLITHLASRLLGIDWLAEAPARAAMSLVEGRYGLEELLTLRTWSLDHRVTLTSGERLHVWSAPPDPGDWRIAALLWTGAGALALWFAASRHRERRRA